MNWIAIFYVCSVINAICDADNSLTRYVVAEPQYASEHECYAYAFADRNTLPPIKGPVRITLTCDTP